ncbi:MAG: c-type cytochrome [Actinomycetia bacterium]|nr:c-type cytochrome [Actinomycetes bacterium]
MSAAPATGQANQPPTAVVAASSTTGQVGTIIVFDGTDSVDFDGTIVSYSWDFGDGTPTVSGNVDEVGLLYHTFEADGAYTVNLDVTDDQGTVSDPSDPTATAIITIGGGTTTTHAPAITTLPPDNASAGALYSSQCALCHGASGEGTTAGPSLQASVWTESATTLAVASGVGVMPGFSESLTSEQIRAVSVYSMRMQTDDPADPIEDDDGEGSTTSAGPAELYETNCAACHGAAGEGRIAASLQSSVFDVDATLDAIANGVGSMPGFSSDLSEDQIKDLAAYSVAFQGGTDVSAEATPTGTLPTGKGASIYAASCAACHGSIGEGASAMPINVPFDNAQLVEIIRVGIGDMPGFATALSEDQIVVLAEYTHALAELSAPPTAAAVPTDEYIVAIQPSRYVEFDTERSSVPLDPDTQLKLALGSMVVLGLLALGGARSVHRAGRASENAGTAGSS